MFGDDDFNIWDDIFGAPDIDRDGDVDMMDAMLRDDMDEDVKRIFFDSDPLYTDEDALFEDERGRRRLRRRGRLRLVRRVR